MVSQSSHRRSVQADRAARRLPPSDTAAHDPVRVGWTGTIVLAHLCLAVGAPPYRISVTKKRFCDRQPPIGLAQVCQRISRFAESDANPHNLIVGFDECTQPARLMHLPKLGSESIANPAREHESSLQGSSPCSWWTFEIMLNTCTPRRMQRGKRITRILRFPSRRAQAPRDKPSRTGKMLMAGLGHPCCMARPVSYISSHGKGVRHRQTHGSHRPDRAGSLAALQARWQSSDQVDPCRRRWACRCRTGRLRVLRQRPLIPVPQK